MIGVDELQIDVNIYHDMISPSRLASDAELLTQIYTKSL